MPRDITTPDPTWLPALCAMARAGPARALNLRIAVSRCAAEYAGRHFPGEYLVIPNSIDPVRFHPGPPRHSPPDVSSSSAASSRGRGSTR